MSGGRTVRDAPLTKRLAEALDHETWCNRGSADLDDDDLACADNRLAMARQVLPVVEAECRQRAAGAQITVLRAAAQEQRNEAGSVPDTDQGTHADGHRCAADFLDRRADAIEGRT